MAGFEIHSFPVELNSLLSKFFRYITHLVCYITWLDVTFDYLQTKSLPQILFSSGLKITNWLSNVIITCNNKGHLKISVSTSRHQHWHWRRHRHRHCKRFILSCKVFIFAFRSFIRRKHTWWSTFQVQLLTFLGVSGDV